MLKHPAEALDIGEHPSADPGARVVKEELGFVMVHGFRVEYEAFGMQIWPGSGWRLLRPKSAHRVEWEEIDSFPSYREAVRAARTMARQLKGRR